MSENAEKFAETVKEWVGSIREDVETLKSVIEAGDKVDKDARKFAATALNYLITRLDIIPDHEPTIGIIDDALAIRACAAFASDHNADEGLDSDTMVQLARLANEADKLTVFLGAEMDAKFKKHVERMVDDPVRGRTPELIVSDGEARARLFDEVETDLLRLPAASFKDPAGALRQLQSYLQAKLK